MKMKSPAKIKVNVIDVINKHEGMVKNVKDLEVGICGLRDYKKFSDATYDIDDDERLSVILLWGEYQERSKALARYLNQEIIVDSDEEEDVDLG